LKAGDKIGAYVIERPLGRGAMGVVYLARHEELGSRYAIKLLSRKLLEDPAAVRRFEIEMESLAKVDGHPGIVRVHSAGRTDKGVPFFAMEYVDGQSLARSMKEGRLDREGALEVVEQVARALAFAHSKGLIHRDVKPDNVLIGDDGVARLSDFGLVRIVGRDEKITRTKDVVGTPFYLAPEQAHKSMGEVGAWTDVYGLGAVLYEALVGEVPHPGKTSHEVVEKVLKGTIVPVRARQPDVSQELERVCMKALSRRPGQRYQSAQQLADELGRAREAWRAERAGQVEPARASRGLFALGAVAALSVIVLASVLFMVVRRSQARQARAEALSAEAEVLAAQVRARRDYEGVISGGEELLAEVAEEEGEAFAVARERLTQVVEQARRRLAELTLRRGDVAAAWDALGRRVPASPEDSDQLGVVLALAAPPAQALPFAEGLAPGNRARLAAWAGDAEACLAALSELDPWRAFGLAHALRPYLAGLAPPVEPAEGDARWRGIALGERALAGGQVPLAALAFTEVDPGSDVQLAVARELGLARVHLARGQVDLVVKHALSAMQATENTFDRARCLAWAAAGAWVADEAPELPEGGDVLAAARRLGPGLPLVRLILAQEEAARGGRVGERLQRARDAARAGDLARARQLAAEVLRGDLETEGASFSRLEWVACAQGGEGPVGLLLARACRLAAAALEGGSSFALEPAERLLGLASAFRPDSPALHLARAQLLRLRSRCGEALGAADEALELAPGDARVLFERARALIGGVQQGGSGGAEPGVGFRAELSRLQGKTDAELEAAAAEGLGQACQALRTALEAAPPPLEAEVRLALAATLIERARRLLASGQAAAGGALAEQEEAGRVLAPLLEGLDVPALASSRARLADALERGEPESVAAAEEALARGLPPHVDSQRLGRLLQALHLRASSGLGQAREHAQALLGLGGDLPARALHHLELALAEPEGGALQRALELGPWLPQPWILEATGAESKDAAATLRRLARLVLEAPDWAGIAPVLAAYAATDLWGQTLGLAALERSLDDGSAAGLTAAALATTQRLRPDPRTFQGPDAGDTAQLIAESDSLGRGALRRVCLARQLDPVRPGLDLLAASCLQRVGSRADAQASGADPAVRADAEFALLCARAAQPWSAGGILLGASLAEAPQVMRDLVARGMALGYVRQSRYAWVRREDRRRLADDASRPLMRVFGRGVTSGLPGRLLDASRRLEQIGFPLAAGVLRVGAARRQRRWLELWEALGEDPGSLLPELGGEPFGEALEDLVRQGGDPRMPRYAALLVGGDPGQALNAWAVRAAPGQLAQLPSQANRGVGRLFYATRLGSTLVRQLAFSIPDGLAWGAHYRLLQPEAPLAALASLERGGGPYEALFPSPWSRSQLLLQAPQSRWAIERSLPWLIEAREWGEVRLALERAIAFGVSDRGFEVRVSLARWLRALAGTPRLATARERMLRLALGLVRDGQRASPFPQALRGAAADLQLDLCGLSPAGQRAQLAKSALADAEAAARGGIPDELARLETNVQLQYRLARARVAAGELESAAEAIERTRKAIDADPEAAWSLGILRLWHGRDPLQVELEQALPGLPDLLGGE
jgi:serine/threonine-protein kinase